MNHIPYQIQKQRLQLQELTDSNVFYGSMVKLKDMTEVMLRLPVLCAGAFILAKGGSEKELLTLQLVKHDKIDSRGWLQVANVIHKNGNIPKPFKTIIDRVCHWITSEKLIEWRHAEVAHGALKFNSDRAFVKDFGKKIKSLDKLLKQLEKDYKDISISDDGSTVTYMGETLQVAPYIFSDSGEAYLFDTYRNGLAKGLCYVLGVKRAMPSEAYVQAYMAQADRLQASGVTGEVITSEMSAAIDELNEAANFEHPTYLRDWLVEGMNAGGSGIAKGTLLLEMERGMGKSAFARALDGKSTDSSYQSFKIGDTFARGYYCSRVGIRSKGDFLFGVRNSLLTDEKDQLIYSSDDKIPSLSENGTPEDFAELLNWCYDRINEKRLLLIIDGIDEIPAEHSDILKLLPTAEMLKDGVYILITCRSKEQVKDEIKNKKDEELSDKEKQYKKLLEDENRQIDTVRSYVYPDRERTYSRNEQHNLETLKSYFERKILPKDGKKNKRLQANIQTIINEPGQRRFLEVRIIGTLIKSGKVNDIAAFAKHPDLFQYYLDYLRTEEYGDSVFSRLTEMLAALACAQEELTFGELAYLLGEDDVTMQLLTFVFDMSGILRISRDYRGNHISLASDDYRTRILEAFPDTVQLHKQAVADILECVDIEALKAQADDKDNPLPDGLLYAAAYLPKYTEQISEKVRDRVCNDIDGCIMNSMKQSILNRRAKTGEVWEEYCRKVRWYNQQYYLIKVIGACYSKMFELEQALKWNNKRLDLCEKYLFSGIIDEQIELSFAYLSRGNIYACMCKYEKALSDFDECIRIMQHLKHLGYFFDLIDLAKAYMNRGNANAQILKYSESLLDFTEGISLLEKMREIGGKYSKLYSIMKDKDNFESVSFLEECHHQNQLYLNDLAGAYLVRGNVYNDIKKRDEALRDFNECVLIREELHQDGVLHDIDDLAIAYCSRGNALEIIGKNYDALLDFNKGISILEEVLQSGKLYDRNNLASAYMDRGQIYDNIGLYDNALRDKDKCIVIRENLLESSKLYDLSILATDYISYGITFRNTGKYNQALHYYNKGIRIMEDLRQSGNLYNWQYYLGLAWLNLGILLEDDLNDIEEAMKVFAHAVSTLEAELILTKDAKDILLELRNKYAIHH